jgi:hypothetical protein
MLNISISHNRDRFDLPIQLPRRTDMHDESIGPMSVENVEEFDVWIFDSRDLVVSVVPHHAPGNATTEEYQISQQ